MAAQSTGGRQTVTIYFPQKHQDQDILGRLKKLAKEKDRSVNYLAVQAIEEFLDRARVED